MGHTLVVPKRHTGSFFDLSTQERDDLLVMLDRTKKILDDELQPQGYNIGINDGAVAGQTVPHVHVHLIPRFAGDLPDPRGGVRWVIPNKAKYWP
jgi:diadenosine tetraphosphate (Ap4A) HIT family hydrolase